MSILGCVKIYIRTSDETYQAETSLFGPRNLVFIYVCVGARGARVRACVYLFLCVCVFIDLKMHSL